MKFCFNALALIVFLMANPAWAQGDAAAGKDKSALCAGCHGADGNSTVAMWPKLAGQHEAYLDHQIRLIQSGERPVPEMMGIVASLSEQDIADISAWYAAQSPKAAVADSNLVDAGERVYRGGNSKSGVPACMACHGPAGGGNPLAGYPALAGQHATYVANSLKRFRDGITWGEDEPGSTVMAGVAAQLSDAEIAAVASYVQGLYSKETP